MHPLAGGASRQGRSPRMRGVGFEDADVVESTFEAAVTVLVQTLPPVRYCPENGTYAEGRRPS